MFIGVSVSLSFDKLMFKNKIFYKTDVGFNMTDCKF